MKTYRKEAKTQPAREGRVTVKWGSYAPALHDPANALCFPIRRGTSDEGTRSAARPGDGEGVYDGSASSGRRG